MLVKPSDTEKIYKTYLETLCSLTTMISQGHRDNYGVFKIVSPFDKLEHLLIYYQNAKNTLKTLVFSIRAFGK